MTLTNRFNKIKRESTQLIIESKSALNMYGKWVLIKNENFNRLINDLYILGCKCRLYSKKKKMFYTEKLEINYTPNPFFFFFEYIHLPVLNL